MKSIKCEVELHSEKHICPRIKKKSKMAYAFSAYNQSSCYNWLSTNPSSHKHSKLVLLNGLTGASKWYAWFKYKTDWIPPISYISMYFLQYLRSIILFKILCH